jgi:NADH:ubiquinone oxidoreductase subunit 6 (subunit J)
LVEPRQKTTPLNVAFIIIALGTLGTAAVAMALRNLIHSALLLVASWAGIASFYLWAGAEFVAFGQVLVYVGAVSMVVLFAVLLTKHSRDDLGFAPDTIGRAVSGLIVGGTVLGVLVGAILSTPLRVTAEAPPVVTVRSLGFQLMGPHAAALLVVGVLLTVALIGAVIIASADRAPERKVPR